MMKEAKGTVTGLLVFEVGRGPYTKECEQPHKLEKARKWIFPYNLQKEGHLNFSLVGPISNF